LSEVYVGAVSEICVAIASEVYVGTASEVDVGRASEVYVGTAALGCPPAEARLPEVVH
jgi:hypothetical protein